MEHSERRARVDELRELAHQGALVGDVFIWLAERWLDTMAGIDDLRAAVADLQSQVTAENTELASIAAALDDAQSQIVQLQGQLAAGSGVSDADLETLAGQVASVAQAAASAVSAAQAPAPDPAPVTPDPTVGGTTDPTAAPTADPGAPSEPTSGGTDTPAPAPTAAPAQTVYTFDGDPSTVDTTVWPQSGYQTAEDPPRPLYYYSGDVNPGDAGGDGVAGAWHAYTGQTEPVSA